jgi:hypothetical protein
MTTTATPEPTTTSEPATTAALTVKRTDATTGAVLPGGCFYVLTEGGEYVANPCDNDDSSGDGNGDGTTTFAGVAVGSYVLRDNPRMGTSTRGTRPSPSSRGRTRPSPSPTS